MRRVALACAVLFAAALAAVGCGNDDGSADGGSGAARDPFTADGVTIDDSAVIASTGDGRWSSFVKILRRTPAGKLATDEVATFGDAMALLGDAKRTKHGSGRTTYVLDASADGQALEDSPRWAGIEDARQRKGALAVVMLGRRPAVIGSDDDGIWIEGRLSDEPICDEGKSDGFRQLGLMPFETSLAVSAPERDVFRATKLINQGIAAYRRADIDLGPAQRAEAPAIAALASIVRLLDLRAADGEFGIIGAGGITPRVEFPDIEEGGTMSDDPGFSATLEAAGIDAALDAVWIDPARIARALGDDRIKGLTGSVVAGMGDGIDGVLAWRSCDGSFGARIAIPAP